MKGKWYILEGRYGALANSGRVIDWAGEEESCREYARSLAEKNPGKTYHVLQWHYAVETTGVREYT